MWLILVQSNWFFFSLFHFPMDYRGGIVLYRVTLYATGDETSGFANSRRARLTYRQVELKSSAQINFESLLHFVIQQY